MNREHFDDREGNDREDAVIPVESFFESGAGRRLWPDSLLGHPAFVDQIEKRKRLMQALHNVQSCVNDPTLSFENHIREGTLTEDHVADLYEELADLLTDTPEYGRVILYLPFEYLPGSDWKPELERLRTQADRLRNAYMQEWRTLLGVHDVRANFVDGDVLETEKREGDLPRVVKAAHFIPILVEKGWLSVDDVLRMYDETGDDVLRESIADTFGVLQEAGFIDAYVEPPSNKEPGVQVEPRTFTLESLQQEIEERLIQATVVEGDATKKRKEWLAEVHKERVIAEAGDEVGFLLERDQLTDGIVEQLTLPTAHTPSQLALIDGVRKAIERAATKDVNQGILLYIRFQEPLRALWDQQHPETRLSLEKLFFRLHRLGIVDDATLSALALSVPVIAGPFSKNVKNLEVELSDVQRVVASIRSHPVLMQYVYPVVLMYGSKLKGYGSKHADTDLGVFIKPLTPDDVRMTIRTELQRTVAPTVLSDAVTEFWLQEEERGLAVRDFEGHDRGLGSSLWSHVLFGAAWKGETNAMRTLFADLLPTYFRATEKTVFGRNVRDLYLEHIEQDLLQYRLMHKGYQRYYPAQGGLKSPHADRLDGQSVFWDSGYRSVATKLFVERVFLPRIKENP